MCVETTQGQLHTCRIVGNTAVGVIRHFSFLVRFPVVVHQAVSVLCVQVTYVSHLLQRSTAAGLHDQGEAAGTAAEGGHLR